MKNQNKIIIAALLITGFILLKKMNTKPTKPGAESRAAFVKRIYPEAVKIGKKIGVPPLFIVAQIALETRYGQSTLFSKYNNPGGIKAVGSQAFVVLPTKEDLNPGINDGKTKTVYQKFARYKNEAEGIEAHSKVLTNRYFKQHANKTTDPIKYAELLQSGRPKYATDDFYVKKIKDTVNNVNKLLLT